MCYVYIANCFKSVVTYRIFFAVIVYLICSNFYFVKADEINKNQTFIEADYLKKNDDMFLVNGNVILKRSKILINADEIKGVKDKKNNIISNNDKKTKQRSKNSKNIKEKKDNDDKYKIYVKNWVKLRTHDDNIIFAKSMFYNEYSDVGNINNAQIYPGVSEHTEMYATKLFKDNDIITMVDVNVCPCKIFTDSNVDNNRRNLFSEISEEDELLEKPIEVNSIDNTDKEMRDKIRYSPISFNAEYMSYNTTEQKATFNKMWIRLFDVPVFYLPSFSFHSNDDGDSGFLMPQIIPIGRRQLGVEIPLYLKIRQNIDFLFSRSQFFDIQKNKKFIKEGNAYGLKDLARYRESTTQFRFRHLISDLNAYESFYKIEAMITDRTQLVDNNTGLGKVTSDGKKALGNRWLIDFRTRMKFTETTFFKTDINITSDKNFAYYYRFDPRQIQENKIHLYDVTENRYLSIELFNYQSRLINLDKKINPIVFPVIRGEYDFKKDRLGGNFYVKGKTFYLNRSEGYDVTTGGVDIGYHLPYFIKNGTKITFDSMIRGIGSNVEYNQYANINMNNDNYYMTGSYRRNQLTIVGFNKLQAEHPVIVDSALGITVVNPKIAFRASPNDGRNIHVPVEDNLYTQMTYHNAFDLVQSEGYGIYDTGYSFVYGFDFKHKINKNIEFFGGIAENQRLNGSVNIEKLGEHSCFRRTLSDIMSNFGFKFYNLSINGFLNYDHVNKELRMVGVGANYSAKYASIYVGYNEISKSANIGRTPMSAISMHANIELTKKLKIISSVVYNIKGAKYNDVYIAPNFTTYSFGAYYVISCMSVGAIVSKTNFALQNTPSDTVFRIKFSFAGFG